MKSQPKTLTDRLRQQFKGVLDGMGNFLIKLGLTANRLTLLGLFGNLVGAVLVARGNLTAGGLVILLTAPLDAVDGTVARLSGGDTHFGAFLDSVSDRYAELALFLALFVYRYQTGSWLDMAGIFLAAAGSVMVSYARARAEGLGFNAKIGLLSRVERYLVILPALIFRIPMVGVWIVAVLSNFTAFQRVWHVWRQQNTRGN